MFLFLISPLPLKKGERGFFERQPYAIAPLFKRREEDPHHDRL